jgi:regulator of protease activity HflC (stomatin/prohibitin superfamily)
MEIGEIFSTAVFIIVVVGIYAAYKKSFTVKENTVVIIERLGKFSRTRPPGRWTMIPWIEQKRVIIDNGEKTDYIDLQERILAIPCENLITRDHLTLKITGSVTYSVSDPVKAVYAVHDMSVAVKQLTKTVCQKVVRDIASDDISSQQHNIAQHMCEQICQQSSDWGITVRNIELRHIEICATSQE